MDPANVRPLQPAVVAAAIEKTMQQARAGEIGKLKGRSVTFEEAQSWTGAVIKELAGMGVGFKGFDTENTIRALFLNYNPDNVYTNLFKNIMEQSRLSSPQQDHQPSESERSLNEMRELSRTRQAEIGEKVDHLLGDPNISIDKCQKRINKCNADIQKFETYVKGEQDNAQKSISDFKMMEHELRVFKNNISQQILRLQFKIEELKAKDSILPGSPSSESIGHSSGNSTPVGDVKSSAQHPEESLGVAELHNRINTAKKTMAATDKAGGVKGLTREVIERKIAQCKETIRQIDEHEGSAKEAAFAADRAVIEGYIAQLQRELRTRPLSLEELTKKVEELERKTSSLVEENDKPALLKEWRTLALHLHPDKTRSSNPHEELMKRMNNIRDKFDSNSR